MPRQSLIRASQLASAEAAETAYYEALQHADLEALMQVWGDDEDMVCVHPGGQRLVGAQAIRASYAQLFAHGALRIGVERVLRQVSPGCAVHSLVERVQVQDEHGQTSLVYVACTNVYLKTAAGWRLVMHHASPGLAQDVAEPAAPARQLH